VDTVYATGTWRDLAAPRPGAGRPRPPLAALERAAEWYQELDRDGVERAAGASAEGLC
jgi:hypothetical protein